MDDKSRKPGSRNKTASCSYSNASAVLPKELLRQVQQHVAGHLWVPALHRRTKARDAKILELRREDKSLRHIGREVGLSPEAVRQVLLRLKYGAKGCSQKE